MSLFTPHPLFPYPGIDSNQKLLLGFIKVYSLRYFNLDSDAVAVSSALVSEERLVATALIKGF